MAHVELPNHGVAADGACVPLLNADRYAAGKAALMKRPLFNPAAALLEAPGRHAVRQITARVSEPYPPSNV